MHLANPRVAEISQHLFINQTITENNMKKTLLIALMAAFATTAFATEQASFSALDVDQNKIISQQEAANVPELIEQWQTLDTNADGQLDFTELAKFAKVEEPETAMAK